MWVFEKTDSHSALILRCAPSHWTLPVEIVTEAIGHHVLTGTEWFLSLSRAKDRSVRICLLSWWKSSIPSRDVSPHAAGWNLLWRDYRKTPSPLWQMSQSSRWLCRQVNWLSLISNKKINFYSHLSLFYARLEVLYTCSVKHKFSKEILANYQIS